jgi:hypothetical protein
MKNKFELLCPKCGDKVEISKYNYTDLRNSYWVSNGYGNTENREKIIRCTECDFEQKIEFTSYKGGID